MNRSKKRQLETLIYVGLWLLAVALLLMQVIRERSYSGQPLLDLHSLWRMGIRILPFMLLFAVNNYLLMPKQLLRNRYGYYFISVALLIAVVWIWQGFQFNLFMEEEASRHIAPPHHMPHPLLPLPIFLDGIYDLLIVGVNLAVALIFQHFDDRLEHERLMKENAENQLTYLKAQINPHFYMNMLNNIHGMIEINPGKAQDMVIEMSGLMRYMLYESSNDEIALSSEIGFIRNYFNIMRERYPVESVAISASLPDEAEAKGVVVPPLLFLVFIENAFKHGISYNGGAYISLGLEIADGALVFRCMNSVSKVDDINKRKGIGLDNVRHRLDLIYGNRYQLDFEQTESSFIVNLILPHHENKNFGD